MPTIIVPHRYRGKKGADEHVEAITDSIARLNSGDIIVADPIEETRGAPSDYNTLLDQLHALKRKYGSADFIVVTGDYGADKTLHGESTAAFVKNILGKEKTEILLSSYTADNEAILSAIRANDVDRFAVPKSAISLDALNGTQAEEVMTSLAPERLITLNGVPHSVTEEKLARKSKEWATAAKEKKVEPIPEPDTTRAMIAVVMPGDVEDAQGVPIRFTKEDAIKLADAIAQEIKAGGTSPVIMVTDGPRTFKYKEGAKSSIPEDQNRERIDSLENNPVATAFINTLEQHFSKENIVRGCIEKGKVPQEGFRAFYGALNRQAKENGEAQFWIDGVSATMLKQAFDVLEPGVKIIACDTPAKTSTHVATLEDFAEQGMVDAQLPLREDGRGYDKLAKNTVPRPAQKPEKDADLVADNIQGIIERKQTARNDGILATGPTRFIIGV